MLMTAGRENVWIGAQNMDQQSITDFVWLGGAMGEINCQEIQKKYFNS